MKKVALYLIVLGVMQSFAAINFPFPHDAKYPYGIKPDTMSQKQMDSVVQNWYTKWKAKYVTKAGCTANEWRIVRVETGNANDSDCVSEAIGYGMIIMVFMENDSNKTQQYFDGFWNYYKNHSNTNGLMNWRIGKDGKVLPGGYGAATDAELDAAFALIMADKQWGSNGAINYLQDGKNLINAIMSKEVTGDNYLRPGDGWDKGNPSYLAPAYYRIFKKVTGENRWDALLSNCYNKVVAYYDTTEETFNEALQMHTGLQPNWSKYEGGPDSPGSWSMDPNSYWWDAIRFPWRQGYDYILNGEAHPLAKKNTAQVSKFFKTLTNYRPELIKSHYSLDGKETPWDGDPNPHLYAEDTMNLAGFVGATAVAAMAEGDQRWMNLLYSRLDDLPMCETGVFWATDYFCDILKMLELLTITGNMPDLTIPFQKDTTTKSGVGRCLTSCSKKQSFAVAISERAGGLQQISVTGVTGKNCMLNIYNASGRLVQSLSNGIRNNSTVTFSLTASTALKGMYVIQAVSGGVKVNQRVTLW